MKLTCEWSFTASEWPYQDNRHSSYSKVPRVSYVLPQDTIIVFDKFSYSDTVVWFVVAEHRDDAMVGSRLSAYVTDMNHVEYELLATGWDTLPSFYVKRLKESKDPEFASKVISTVRAAFELEMAREACREACKKSNWPAVGPGKETSARFEEHVDASAARVVLKYRSSHRGETTYVSEYIPSYGKDIDHVRDIMMRDSSGSRISCRWTSVATVKNDNGSTTRKMAFIFGGAKFPMFEIVTKDKAITSIKPIDS